MQLLNTRTQTRRGIGNALGSLVANAMVKTNNTDWAFNKEKNIYFERDKEKALPNYLVKICISGMISNIGISNYKRRVKKATKEFSELMEE